MCVWDDFCLTPAGEQGPFVDEAFEVAFGAGWDGDKSHGSVVGAVRVVSHGGHRGDILDAQICLGGPGGVTGVDAAIGDYQRLQVAA